MTEELRFTCLDCKLGDYPMFMVNDELWEQWGCLELTLCLDCFTKRVSRPLTSEDFRDYKSVPCNLHNQEVQKILS
jgi:hypothetical protein